MKKNILILTLATIAVVLAGCGTTETRTYQYTSETPVSSGTVITGDSTTTLPDASENSTGTAQQESSRVVQQGIVIK